MWHICKHYWKGSYSKLFLKDKANWMAESIKVCKNEKLIRTVNILEMHQIPSIKWLRALRLLYLAIVWKGAGSGKVYQAVFPKHAASQHKILLVYMRLSAMWSQQHSGNKIWMISSKWSQQLQILLLFAMNPMLRQFFGSVNDHRTLIISFNRPLHTCIEHHKLLFRQKYLCSHIRAIY